MNLPPDYHPEFGSIIDALVEVAHIGSVDALLRRVMAGLNGLTWRPPGFG